MTALDDFIMGASPQVDASVCRQMRIGYDRVWRVAVEMFHVLRPGAPIFISYESLSQRTGIHGRTIRTAVKALEASGVITTEEGFFKHGHGPSRHRRPTWTPSVGRTLNLDIRTVTVDPQEAAGGRVGVDRAWRVAVMAKALIGASVDVLGRLTGLAARQVRQALGAAGLAAGKANGLRWRKRKKDKAPKAVWSRRDPRREKLQGKISSPQSPTGTSGRARERARRRTRPVHRWYIKCLYGGQTMPDDIFCNYVPDDSEIPVRKLSSHERAHARVLADQRNRMDRPVQTWTPMDVAKEFKHQFLTRYPGNPGDTGNMVTLAKILGKRRNDHGYDARVELEVVQMFLGDASNIHARSHIPVWKKFLYALTDLYPEASRRAKLREPGSVVQEVSAAPSVPPALVEARERNLALALAWRDGGEEGLQRVEQERNAREARDAELRAPSV